MINLEYEGGMTEYDVKLLKELVTGEDQGLSWGAVMSVCIEYLSGRGYVTGLPHYKATQKGIDFVNNLT